MFIFFQNTGCGEARPIDPSLGYIGDFIVFEPLFLLKNKLLLIVSDLQPRTNNKVSVLLMLQRCLLIFWFNIVSIAIAVLPVCRSRNRIGACTGHTHNSAARRIRLQAHAEAVARALQLPSSLGHAG